ncbi:enoyl-CoA hydratase/isomerase family protein [Phenylobacterium sp.]|uniref:enoyl-CoA hydratase/isomerase family protein n=1 Tax=Phenylobacterium sp. TaxID=1871053 RepID=UPI002DF1FD4E|nr:enoyl-CoA hydratase/isomerase family protein [Phenylobacterium sp.]
MPHEAFDAGKLSDVAYACEDGVAVITLNRPHEGNAITRTMHDDLELIWDEVKANPAVRVAIVTGAGERHFCTGASVSGLSTDKAGGALRNRPLEEAVRLTPYQNKVWKPVICAVNGLVAGGGLHFVVDSDIVVASETAAFMDTHASVGQVGALENIGLARRMTMGAALLMTLVGRDYRMPAARAHQLGLVDLLEPTAKDAMARSLELAHSIKKNSPQALALSKQAIWGAMEQGYSHALEAGWSLIRLHWAHPDFAEGPAAFGAKRAPVWDPDPSARRKT